MDQPRPILVVVHPGSACGSADFHHGRSYAYEERAELARTLRAWTGDVLVVDSDLSDELPRYRGLAAAIDDVLARAGENGHAARLLADDEQSDYDGIDWVVQVRDHVMATGARQATVTGAWYHADDDHGCVNAVRDALVAAGLVADVDDSAIPIGLGN